MVAGFCAGTTKGDGEAGEARKRTAGEQAGEVLGGGAGPGPAVEAFIGDLPTIRGECGEGTGEALEQLCGELPPVPALPTVVTTTDRRFGGFKAPFPVVETRGAAGSSQRIAASRACEGPPSAETRLPPQPRRQAAARGEANEEGKSRSRTHSATSAKSADFTVPKIVSQEIEKIQGAEIVKNVEVPKAESVEYTVRDLKVETEKDDKIAEVPTVEHVGNIVHLPNVVFAKQEAGVSSEVFTAEVETYDEEEVGEPDMFGYSAEVRAMPHAGKKRSWAATVEANQTAFAKAAAAEACRIAIWRLEHDVLVGAEGQVQEHVEAEAVEAERTVEVDAFLGLAQLLVGLDPQPLSKLTVDPCLKMLKGMADHERDLYFEALRRSIDLDGGSFDNLFSALDELLAGLVEYGCSDQL
ncbi:unnamed protein product, partial [Prorocentrum cordatum]